MYRRGANHRGSHLQDEGGILANLVLPNRVEVDGKYLLSGDAATLLCGLHVDHTMSYDASDGIGQDSGQGGGRSLDIFVLDLLVLPVPGISDLNLVKLGASIMMSLWFARIVFFFGA